MCYWLLSRKDAVHFERWLIEQARSPKRLVWRAGWIYLGFLLVCFGGFAPIQASPVVLDTNLQIRLILYTTNSSGAPSTRIAKDPRNDQLYYLKSNGDIYQLNLKPGAGSTSARAYSSADHGL